MPLGTLHFRLHEVQVQKRAKSMSATVMPRRLTL